MYIIKMTDEKHNEWCYFENDHPLGRHQMNFFLNTYCFKSKNKAKSYIKKLLHSSWIRPGYKYSNFEILQVVIDPGYIRIPKSGQYFMVLKEK